LVVAFGELRGEVNNGGFNQYFFNSGGDHVSWAIEAARAALCTDLASLVERAIDAVGNAPYLSDWNDRRNRVLELSDKANDHLDALDDQYAQLEISTDLDAAMRALAADCLPQQP
jgi:hypothetical protein